MDTMEKYIGTTDQINERTMYDNLINMVSVVSKKNDWLYMNDIVSRAYTQKLISKKEFDRLMRELEDIKRTAEI